MPPSRVGASVLLALTATVASAQPQPIPDEPYAQQRAVAAASSAPPRSASQDLPAPLPGATLSARGRSGQAVAVAGDRLHEWRDGAWLHVALRNGDEGWDPSQITALAYDGSGRLWFGSSQGVGVRELDGRWRFIDPARGLPVLGITSMSGAPDGAMWIGTSRGAIRIAGDVVEYRQGRRWLPGDRVREVFVDADGTAWFETDQGTGAIASLPITLGAKAAAYEAAIDRHHRRTPYGYVVEAHLKEAGEVATSFTTDNDNDGLWTGMYGAAQCFAFAVTRSDVARGRARRAFEALRFLVDVTQGGSHSPPDGFPARSIMPTSGPDPNVRDSQERDRQRQQQRDSAWKVITPRWPQSADRQWYWKSDTSSDELDGHYFFYALYHDLVARDDAERAEVAAVVRRITDHLLSHEFTLIDHDGAATRWGVFSPGALNLNPQWIDERGLNSLSMLTYLRVAHHVTGEVRFDAAARTLIDRHGYAMNLLYPKVTLGVGGGNQSDDEMAFMNYYHLLKYEKDPAVKSAAARSLHAYWQLERPERNPFFNLVAAVSLEGATFSTAFGTESLSLPLAAWRDDTLDTLRRFPIDLVDHGLTNSHRLDLVPVDAHVRPDAEAALGLRRTDRKVLPVDERMVFHWNVDPYALDNPGGGLRLADGSSYLLPYYMAIHHGVLAAPTQPMR